MRRFEDKTVLVTGAASGIGKATAERLADEGARLMLCDVQAAGLEATAKLTSEKGAETLTNLCNVADPQAVRDAVGETVAGLGGLDVLCNVAGILKFGHSHEFALEDWERLLAVNLTGTFLMCREALPHLLERRGNIVNMGSTAALAGTPWAVAYAASKGGVVALTRTLAVEYGRQGLRANAICPGSIQTPIQEAFAFPEGADKQLIHRIMALDEPRGPETVASTVAFLASDDAAHINGVALRVDGATLS